MPLPLKLFEVSDVVLKDETKGANTHPVKEIIILYLLVRCCYMYINAFIHQLKQ